MMRHTPLPDQPQSLAERDLIRGEEFALPSGEDVARLLCSGPRSGAELGDGEPTPLWLYIRKEPS